MGTLTGVDIDTLMVAVPSLKGKLSLDEPMSFHTSFKIGGPADVFAVTDSALDLRDLLRWAFLRSWPVFILGAGTNLLVADKGIRGIVVRLGAGFGRVEIKDGVLRAGAAARVPRVLRKSLGLGLSGLEGLAGIPGTIGGAVSMNAGTPSGCVRDALEKVVALSRSGELHELVADELGLAYRASSVQAKGLIVIETSFRLRPMDPASANGIVRDLMSKRRRTQPVGIGTAGSVFKNPSNGYAGEMLDKVGAKGMQIGGARVSSKHANFIENTGGATAEDVRELMLRMGKLVEEEFGVVLEPEIQFVGEW